MIPIDFIQQVPILINILYSHNKCKLKNKFKCMAKTLM